MSDIGSVGFAALVMLAVALALGIAILLVSKKFHVQADDKVDDILDILPGANCGACGYVGCEAYAKALATNADEPLTLCTVGGGSTVDALAKYLGQDEQEFTQEIASVKCMGSKDFTQSRYEYQGLKTCAASNVLQSGPSMCQYGCMGFGDCVAVCDYDAIHIVNGLAIVDPDKCTACKKCVGVCPKQLIHMVPKRNNLHEVRCSNLLSGVLTKQMCDIGCIACKKCQKVCEDNAIEMRLGVACIDQNKCTQCGKCYEVCPTSCITEYMIYRVEKKPDNKEKISSATA